MTDKGDEGRMMFEKSIIYASTYRETMILCRVYYIIYVSELYIIRFTAYIQNLGSSLAHDLRLAFQQTPQEILGGM